MEIGNIDRGGSGDAKRAGSHETNAESYLELARKETKESVERDKFLEEAAKEAKEALRQDEFSWTAQNVAGQVMKETGNVEAALIHFCRALAIRPGNEDIRKDFNECRSVKEATTAADALRQWYSPLQKPFDIAELEECSRKGSVTARHTIKKIQLKSAVEELLKKLEKEGRQLTEPENSSDLIEAMYRYYAEPSIYAFHHPYEEEPHLEKFLDAMLPAYGNEKSDLDRKIRLCFGNVSRSDEHFRVQVILEALRRYPEEIPLYRLLLHVRDVNYFGVDKVSDEFKKALLQAPDDLHLLYGMACITSEKALSANINANFRPVIEVLRRLIDKAPEDHVLVPYAYYYLAQTYHWEWKLLTAKGGKTNAEGLAEAKRNRRKTFRCAQAMEKRQLSHYLPFACSEKHWIGSILSHPFAFGIDKTEEEKTRAVLLKSHRKLVKDKRDEIKAKAKGSNNEDGGGISANLEKLKLSFQQPYPLKVSEINDRIFLGRILNLTLIEDPVQVETSLWRVCDTVCVRVIAKVEGGDATRVNVYYLPAGVDYESMLGVGSRFSVPNPIFGKTVDGEVLIQVKKPNELIARGKIKDMCRYCGRENASKTCAKCKRARYCSENCQISDWRNHGHKLICNSEN